MKNNFYPRLWLLLASLAIVVASCTKTEDMLRGTSINVDTELLLNPLNIQIVADPNESQLPSDLDVDVTGPDADKVYTVFGEKKLEVNVNEADPRIAMLPIGIRRIEPVSSVNPIEFSLILKAEGYNTVTRNYRISSLEEDMCNIRLLRTDNTADGIQTEGARFIVNEKGAPQPVSFQTRRNSKDEYVKVEVQQGTRMFTADGETVVGDVDAALNHYNFRVQGVNEMAPASLYSNAAVDKDGNVLSLSSFDLLAMYTLDMHASSGEVRSFSKPLDVTVQVQADATNPATSERIKAGDVIPVWSYNEKLGEWQEETTATITTGTGGMLYANFEQEHLSIWLLGGRFPCRDQTRVLVTNNEQQRNGPKRYYYVEVYRASDNTVLWTDYTRFYDNESIELFAGFTIPIYFRIYSEPAEACSTQEVLFESEVFNSCGGEIEVDVTEALLQTDLDRVRMFVEVAGTCSSDFNDLVVRPSLPILYRENGCETWQPMGWLRNGEGATQALERGKYYDFRISHRTLDRCIFNLQVPLQDTTVLVDSPVYNFMEEIDVVYEGDDIRFNYTDIQVPDLACDEYVDYLNDVPR